jgi:RsiW-degrading membrane proteinase PrsW (M82 family)
MAIVAVAVLGALIPTLLYVLFVWWLDRYEKEPLPLLALAFLWGAGPAALLSVGVEMALDGPLSALEGQGLRSGLLTIGLSAPVLEETFKGIALLGLVLLFHREFDDVLDGIVYGAMIGLGFAMTENLFGYFLPTLHGQGLAFGLTYIFLRAIVFGTNHALWTGITGAAMGYGRLARTQVRRFLAPVGGWALAVLLHGIHNVTITMAPQKPLLSLGIGLIVNWGGVLLLLLVAASALRRESRWVERGLVEELNSGLLTAQEFDLLRTPGKRLRLRWQAYRQGGKAAYRAVGCYFQTATELAFKRRQLARMGDEGNNSAEIRYLRQELSAYQLEAWPWLWPDRP